MPTLRAIVDGKVIWAQAPPPSPAKKKTPPSPAAQHVGEHMQDPFGATKDMVDELNQAKQNYESTKTGAIMKLLPVQKVIEGITQSHRLDTPQANPMDEQMGYTDPNDPMAQQNGGPGAMAPGGVPPTGAGPGNSVPGNMGQTPGQMNMNRPSQSGFQPGSAPGFPSQSVRPGKFGLPLPGTAQQGNMAGNPGQSMPGGPPNPQGNQFNPQAKPPQGNKQLPGAKGPNDPKVQGQVKKAQGNSNGGSGKSGSQGSKGKVNIQVHADRAGMPSAMPLSAWAGLDRLRSCNSKEMDAGGPGSGRRPGAPAERENYKARQQMWKRIRQRDPDWKNEMSGGTFKPFGKLKAYTGAGMSSQNRNTTTTFVSKGPGNAPGAGNSMPASKMRAGVEKEGWVQPTYPNTPEMNAKKKKRMSARMENLTQ